MNIKGFWFFYAFIIGMIKATWHLPWGRKNRGLPE